MKTNWIVILFSIFLFSCVSQQSKITDSDNIDEAEKKVFTPSDYIKYPTQTYQYFSGLLPKPLFDKLRDKDGTRYSFITSCEGSYVEKDKDEYVVGYIDAKANTGYAKVYSVGKKDGEISETLVQKYPKILGLMFSHYFPVVGVYCEKGFVFAKTNMMDGLPAYKYDAKKKKFIYSEEDSVTAI
ncbi:MAG: hypothetical protein CL677_07745 [Bdellovibrionaceae bacterium]|nr:hypothetical protein [Pseudobdellovibrionaceae bacterium]|tara:strand:- start:24646 stop:25197 length:552 start_codon:yes stop_codon:yes gene_type:complete